MKKKVMSQDALASMLSADEEAPLVEQEIVETNAEDVVVEPEAEDVVVEPEATEEEEVVVEEPTELEALTEEFDTLKAESTETITNLETTLVETVGKLEAAEAGATELKEIVVGQISKMRMVLKVAAVDMTDWSTEAVVEEYATSSEAFMKSLPVGSVVPENNVDNTVEPPVKSSLDVSNVNALGFK